MKILIDTNIILDALLGRAYHEVAEKIILLAAEEKIDAYITANCVTDIYYFIYKHYKDSLVAKDLLNKLFKIFSILSLTDLDCLNALEIKMEDYEDGILACCAERNKIEFIISRNIKDFKNSPVVAITPEDFLKNIIPA